MPEKPTHYAENIQYGANVQQGENLWNITIQPKTVDDAKKILRYLDEKRGKLEGPGLPRQLKPEVLLNRYREFREIQNFFEDKSAVILYVWGISGIGKSTLVRGALETRNKRIPVIWIHCKGLDLDTLLLQMNAGFRLKVQDLLRSNASSNVKIQTVLGAAKSRCILVLNEFEAFLDEKECYKSEDVELLVKDLSSLEHKIKVLATTTRLPRGLNQANLNTKIRRLKGLEKRYAVEHFEESAKRIGLSKKTVTSAMNTEAFKKIQGHPYFLELFALALCELPISEVEDALLEVTEIGEYIIKKVLKELGADELGVVQVATIFPTEFKFDVLKYVYENTKNLEFHSSILRALIRASLVENDVEAQAYYVHPLLRDAVPCEAHVNAIAHSTAADWFLSKPIDPEKFETWDEALYHLRQAAEVGQNPETFKEYKNFVLNRMNQLSGVGWGRRMADELRVLERLAKNNIDKSIFLFRLADQLDHLGEKSEALAMFKEFNKRLPQIQEPLSKEGDPDTFKVAALTKIRLGVTLVRTGHVDEARRLADEAEPLVDFIDDIQCKSRYSDLRFQVAMKAKQPDPKEMWHWASEYSKYAVQQHKDSPSPETYDSIAEAHFALGIAFVVLGDMQIAGKHISQYLQIKVEIGNLPGIAACLRNISHIMYVFDPVKGGTYLLTWEQISLEVGEVIEDEYTKIAEQKIKKFLYNTENHERGRQILRAAALDKVLPYYERALRRRGVK